MFFHAYPFCQVTLPWLPSLTMLMAASVTWNQTDRFVLAVPRGEGTLTIMFRKRFVDWGAVKTDVITLVLHSFFSSNLLGGFVLSEINLSMRAWIWLKVNLNKPVKTMLKEIVFCLKEIKLIFRRLFCTYLYLHDILPHSHYHYQNLNLITKMRGKNWYYTSIVFIHQDVFSSA